MTYYNSTAPSSPPQNVMVTSVIPASLNVSWQPPPAIDQNGMIINYIINYTEVKVDATVSMSFASGTTMIIPGLAAHVNYSVVIAAINVNGTGEFSSPPVVESSGEDSKLKLIVYYFNVYKIEVLIIRN